MDRSGGSGVVAVVSAGPVLGHWVGSFEHAAATQTVLALAGFATVKREGVQLTSGFTGTINADMKVGALNETVPVARLRDPGGYRARNTPQDAVVA